LLFQQITFQIRGLTLQAAPICTMPCTSGIKPEWILHAIQKGFDGVFIASDGEECAYLPDCAERSARIMERAQHLLTESGHEPRRLRMSAICSVCAEPFTNQIKDFYNSLQKLGPARKG